MKKKYISSLLAALILSSGALYSDTIRDVGASSKIKANPEKYFDFKDLDANNNIDGVLSKFNIDKEKNIIILHDNFSSTEHGEAMLGIIKDDSNFDNIILYDYETNIILSANDLEPVSDKKINFELLIKKVAKKFKNNKVVVSMSNGRVFSRMFDIGQIRSNFEYYVNLATLIKDNINVSLNKSMGNLEAPKFKSDFGYLYDNKIDQAKFINEFDSKIDEMIYSSKYSSMKEIENAILKEFKQFQISSNLHQDSHFLSDDDENAKIFIKSYMKYKRNAESLFSDALIMKEATQYVKRTNPESDIENRLTVIKGITPDRFKRNVSDYQEKYGELPAEIVSFVDNLNSSLDIKDNADVKISESFFHLSDKYGEEFPSIFKGDYDSGLGNDKISGMKTGFHGVSIGGFFKHYGTSITTALKSSLDSAKKFIPHQNIVSKTDKKKSHQKSNLMS